MGKEKFQCQQEIKLDRWVKVPEQAERQVIAVMQSNPMSLSVALEEVSGAALVVKERIEAKDRGAGWADGAGLVPPRVTSSVSVPAAGIKSPTSPGSHVHSKYAPAARIV